VLLLLFLLGVNAELRPVNDSPGTYRAWQQNDNIPFAIGEPVDFRVVIDDGIRKGNEIDKNRNFRLEICSGAVVKSDYLDDMMFKKPIQIGKNNNIKLFSKRMITVEPGADIFTLRAVSEDQDTFFNDGKMLIDMEAKDFYKTVIEKEWKKHETTEFYNAASPIDTKKQGWYRKSEFGTLRFRIIGEPAVNSNDIKSFILTINGQANRLEMDNAIGKWVRDDSKPTSHGFIITGVNDPRTSFDLPHVLIKRNSDNSELIHSLTAKFVLTHDLSETNKNFNPVLERNLLKKIPESEGPMTLFCAIFGFVSFILMTYFIFVNMIIKS
jgi:hypothetical protein